jgi:mRNA interferase MazF
MPEHLPNYQPRNLVPRIKAAPAIRQIYWCDFEFNPVLPEMGKTRPVIILYYKNTLSGHCLVLPVSSDSQQGASSQWAHQLSFELEPDHVSYVVCNHLYTVSTARLQPLYKKAVPRLSEAEFNLILTKVLAWLPKLS